MKATRKLVFTLILATLALVATLSVTPQPAYAINCPSNFLGCPYSHQTLVSGYVCCMHRCSDGTIIRGICGLA